MCIKCKTFVDRLIDEKGMTESEAIDWLWNHTAFPFEAPDDFKIINDIEH